LLKTINREEIDYCGNHEVKRDKLHDAVFESDHALNVGRSGGDINKVGQFRLVDILELVGDPKSGCSKHLKL